MCCELGFEPGQKTVVGSVGIVANHYTTETIGKSNILNDMYNKLILLLSFYAIQLDVTTWISMEVLIKCEDKISVKVTESA